VSIATWRYRLPAEIETICERIGILKEGRLVYQGRLSELLAGAARSRWRVVVRSPATPVIDALRAAAWVSSVTELEPGELEVSAPDPVAVEEHLPAVLATCPRSSGTPAPAQSGSRRRHPPRRRA
jgi:ABC-2 type transport system ATP-binding protein